MNWIKLQSKRDAECWHYKRNWLLYVYNLVLLWNVYCQRRKPEYLQSVWITSKSSSLLSYFAPFQRQHRRKLTYHKASGLLKIWSFFWLFFFHFFVNTLWSQFMPSLVPSKRSQYLAWIIRRYINITLHIAIGWIAEPKKLTQKYLNNFENSLIILPNGLFRITRFTYLKKKNLFLDISTITYFTIE